MTTPVKTRRVFVTGATGYLGARLIPLLLERGHQVTALARPESVRKVPTGCQIVVGNPLESGTFVEQVRGADTFVQLVGVPKPAPWKGPQFRAIDGPSAMAAIRTAREAGVRHMVYVSVAHPAPIMRDYIAVRSECVGHGDHGRGVGRDDPQALVYSRPGSLVAVGAAAGLSADGAAPGNESRRSTVRFGDNSGDAHRDDMGDRTATVR